MKLRFSLLFFLIGGAFFSATFWITTSLWGSTPISKGKAPSLLEHIANLKNTDLLVRLSAVRSLGELEAEAQSSIPALLTAEVPIASEYLIKESLQKIGQYPSLNEILPLVHSPLPRIKARVLWFFGELDHFPEEALPLLLESLSNTQEEILTQSIRLVRVHKISHPEIPRLLYELFKREELWLGEEVTYTFIALGPSVVPFLLEKSEQDPLFQKSFWRVKILGNLLTTQKLDLDILNELVRDLSTIAPGIKHEVLNQLSMLLESSPSSLPVIAPLLEDYMWFELLKDSEWQVCEAVINFLANYELLPLDCFLRALYHPNWVVRLGVIRCLGKMKQNARLAIPALLHTLKDSHHEVVQTAMLSLKALGNPLPDSVPEIISLLRSSSWRVRAYSAKALGQVETTSKDLREKMIDALIPTLFDSELDVRFRSVEALGNIGVAAKKSIPYIEASLNMLSNSLVTEEMERVLELLKKSSK